MPAKPLGDNASRILVAGALVGALDLLFAIALYVVVLKVCNIEQLLQAIARSVLGKSAMSGGLPAAALGLGVHFSVAFSWTVAYAVALRYSELAVRVRDRLGPLRLGMLYGMVIWLAMDLVIVPLTHANPTPFGSGLFYVLLANHILLVGPPITLIIRPSYLSDRTDPVARFVG